MRSSISIPLQSLAKRLEFPISGNQELHLSQYLETLIQWNTKVNLTGASSTKEIIDQHLPDSMVMAKVIPQGIKVIDIGSGGGLPGIPYAILRPDSTILLVEPRAKRTAFLSAVSRQLQLPNVTILRERLESLSPQHHVYFSSKATFDPQRWLDLSRPLCDRDSRVISFLGRETNPDQLTPTPLSKFLYSTNEHSPRCLTVHGP